MKLESLICKIADVESVMYAHRDSIHSLSSRMQDNEQGVEQVFEQMKADFESHNRDNSRVKQCLSDIKLLSESFSTFMLECRSRDTVPALVESVAGTGVTPSASNVAGNAPDIAQESREVSVRTAANPFDTRDPWQIPSPPAFPSSRPHRAEDPRTEQPSFSFGNVASPFPDESTAGPNTFERQQFLDSESWLSGEGRRIFGPEHVASSDLRRFPAAGPGIFGQFPSSGGRPNVLEENPRFGG